MAAKKITTTGFVNRVCAALGLAPADIRSITLTPPVVTVVSYQRNENGAKYLTDDGEVAVDTHELKSVWRG